MDKKRNNNEVDCFLWYMFNNWDKSEAIKIFGSKSDFKYPNDDLALHIYNRWVECREKRLGDLWWYAELDRTCQQRIVDRAKQIYMNESVKMSPNN